MECLNSFGAFNSVKMLVMSNIFRAAQQPPKHHIFPSKSANDLATLAKGKSYAKTDKKFFNTFGSFKSKNGKITISDVNNGLSGVKNASDLKSETKVEESDVKNVISSAKGLLETDLDDLFNDTANICTKNLSEQLDPVTSKVDSVLVVNNVENGRSRNSLATTASTCDDDDVTTDSDDLDEMIRDQSRCVGARRFGYILRRVISRNGKCFEGEVYF